MIPPNRKIFKKELQNILGVSYPTALKEYKIYLDILELQNRKYLLYSDLIRLGIVK